MTDTIHSVTNPAARRTKNHRSEQALWRCRKRWKALVSLHCHGSDAVCVHCGKHHGQPAKKKGGKPIYLTINHLSRGLYVSEDLYCTWNPALMEICCTTCNWMYEKGKMSCPVCHNQYISCMEPDGMCQGCYDKAHPEEANIRIEAKQKKADEKKALLKKLRDAVKARAKLIDVVTRTIRWERENGVHTCRLCGEHLKITIKSHDRVFYTCPNKDSLLDDSTEHSEFIKSFDMFDERSIKSLESEDKKAKMKAWMKKQETGWT